MSINERIDSLDWKSIAYSMNSSGFVQLEGFLTSDECDDLTGLYSQESLFRKTVVMERHRFGLGEYKYFDYPLPSLIGSIRQEIYPYLVPIANSWMTNLWLDKRFPGSLEELQEQCRATNQTKPTPLILKYGLGGYNTLHQDLYGDVYFPIQMVFFLSEYGSDYTGGEFVMTEQVPRAQSKAIVLKPKKGDALIFTTQFRPIKGSRGYYRANMRHGVSEVQSGNRHTLGIIFHDAIS